MLNVSHRLLARAALVFFLVPAANSADLRPFTARYSLTTDGVTIGARTLTLSKLDSGLFVFESMAWAVGLGTWFKDDRITERSEWHFHTGDVQPLRYRYQHARDAPNRIVTIDFDWERGHATNTVDSVPWSMPIPTGTQDKLVYLLSLMRDLHSGVTHISYPVADGGTLKTYKLHIVTETDLDTPLGRLATVKLSRVEAPSQREVLIWCAPDLNYLPVRMTRSDRHGDHVLDMLIQSVRGLPFPGKK